MELIDRGKRIDNNQWVYGYYWYDTSKITNSYGDWKVDPETKGHYIREYDKNGTKVFTGDIFYCKSLGIADFVDWDNNTDNYGFGTPDYLEHWVFSEIIQQSEIVGNIYDDSQLLKQLRNKLKLDN